MVARHLFGLLLSVGDTLTPRGGGGGGGGAGMHWKGGGGLPPLQGAQPVPSHCLPDAKCLDGICNRQ